MNRCIAVFDIGKTNKKILIFDEQLKLIHSEYKTIPAEEGRTIQTERAMETFDWFIHELASLSKKFRISAISITAHGATFACVDANGKLAIPVLSYTNDPGKDFHSSFFRKYGDEKKMHAELATSNMGGLANLAKGIEYARLKFPAGFDEAKHILNYPQFFGFLLTGKAGAEPTYVGCHSYLLNFKDKNWSYMADRMGIRDKLPLHIGNSHSVLGRISSDIAEKTGLDKNVVVTLGIHDSNASFLPYLIRGNDKFILNSTGTWFVAMSPSKCISFSEEELDSGVFCNADVYGNPIKTAIFMGGGEMNCYFDILHKYFGLKKHCPLNLGVCQKAIVEARAFILPGFMRGTGPFPASHSRIVWDGTTYNLADLDSKEKFPDFFNDTEYAYAVLNISLAIQTAVMLKNVGLEKGMRIYIEGGFRKNETYCALVAALCPQAETVLSDMSEATSFGAAILAKSALDGLSLEEIGKTVEINTEPVQRINLDGLERYKKIFFDNVPVFRIT